jgi:hypothetical protein
LKLHILSIINSALRTPSFKDDAMIEENDEITSMLESLLEMLLEKSSQLSLSTDNNNNEQDYMKTVSTRIDSSLSSLNAIVSLPLFAKISRRLLRNANHMVNN